MNTLLDIDKYYYYSICIFWPCLIFIIIKNRLFFNNLPKKIVVLNKGIAIGLCSVFLFYACIPISFFYFDRFESNPLGSRFTSVWGFSIYKSNSSDFKYKIDTYELSSRTGQGTRRQRVVIEIDQKCYYSHILAYQSGAQRFIDFAFPKDEQNITCRRAEDVERDIIILRAFLALILIVSAILMRHFMIKV